METRTKLLITIFVCAVMAEVANIQLVILRERRTMTPDTLAGASLC